MTRTNKTMHQLCALALLCGVTSMASAETTRPVILGPAQMDAVTAGGAGGAAMATAIGSFGFTSTSANVINQMVTQNDQPTLAGYVAGSESTGSATAAGTGAATSTTATTTAVAPGTFVITYTINANHQIGGTSVSGSATMSFGSFSGPQIALF